MIEDINEEKSAYPDYDLVSCYISLFLCGYYMLMTTRLSVEHVYFAPVALRFLFIYSIFKIKNF